MKPTGHTGLSTLLVSFRAVYVDPYMDGTDDEMTRWTGQMTR